jgi:hypothetical protein
MHAAHQFKSSMFNVSVAGQATTAAELLQWQSHDRLGIVATQPFGALGAGLLTLLAVTQFYAADRKRRMRPLYPPIYLFHVGGNWGFHGELDFWPDRKEVKTSSDPSEVLRAINTIGVTHLAVPDAPTRTTSYRYKEPEEAFDRLKQCYVYSPDGTAPGAAIEITTTTPAVMENLQRVALPLEVLAAGEKAVAETPRYQTNTPLAVDFRHYYAVLRASLGDIDPDDAAVVRTRKRLADALAAGRLSESIRRIATKDALDLLGNLAR